jgi:hypothetical protein
VKLVALILWAQNSHALIIVISYFWRADRLLVGRVHVSPLCFPREYKYPLCRQVSLLARIPSL